MSELFKVASDDGYSYTKTAYFDPSGRIVESSIASRFANANLGGSISLSGEPIDTYRTVSRGEESINTNPSRVCVTTESSQQCNTAHEGYSTSEQNRCVIHHAMLTSGLNPEQIGPIHLSVTLPISVYFDGLQSDLIKRRQDSLMKTVYRESGLSTLSPMFDIQKVSVLPEALMAYVDHIMDEKGQQINDPNEVIAVVDIGGRTTDIALVRPKLNIERNRSSSIELGVQDFYKKVKEMIKAEHNGLVIGDLPIDQAIKNNGICTLRGEKTDLSKYLKTASDIITRELRSRVDSVIQNNADVDRILYVGGGSIVLGSSLSEHPNVHVAVDPGYANARGVLKYVTYFG